jgi:hypothetical protein
MSPSVTAGATDQLGEVQKKYPRRVFLHLAPEKTFLNSEIKLNAITNN